MMTSLWIMMCLRCLIEDDSKLGNTQLVCLAKTFTFLVLLHAIEFFTVWGKIIWPGRTQLLYQKSLTALQCFSTGVTRKPRVPRPSLIVPHSSNDWIFICFQSFWLILIGKMVIIFHYFGEKLSNYICLGFKLTF
jgi:hypothetical protein